jgi:magnesium chelatase subunit I
MEQNTNPPAITTLGQLRASGYEPRSVKTELRMNLLQALNHGVSVFKGIYGFEETVIPDIERAILSRHHILLLGLRGQAKTKIARLLIRLLDEWIPILHSSELPEDPMNPITVSSKELIAKMGDNTPIGWLHRDDRYVEKLATPDVSIADLIGDVDPIKAANLKLSYSDEQVIHFGLVPRAHRGIFVINELPDLQPRIQVALFNILQEGDIQIRGFKKRLHLDIEFVFTANPEDYTNRGSIITPLKDRIDSQILTHYPTDTAVSQRITRQEARLAFEQIEAIHVPSIIHEILDQVAFEARESDFVDQKSGVSARLNISAYENLVSAVERRMILNKESKGVARLNDFWAIVPAITGKVELVYEGEQEGAYQVALTLIHDAVKTVFLRYFPNPEQKRSTKDKNPFGVITAWFSGGNEISFLSNESEAVFISKLNQVSGLKTVVQSKFDDVSELNAYLELVLHGLAEFQVISKELIGQSAHFRDDLAGALGDLDSNESDN